jgi:hypothetical protein
MMCRPACHSPLTSHAVSWSSESRKIQSKSPLGVATNPSSETCIFKMTFVINPPNRRVARAGSNDRRGVAKSSQRGLGAMRSGQSWRMFWGTTDSIWQRHRGGRRSALIAAAGNLGASPARHSRA